MKSTTRTLLASLILSTTASADIFDNFNDGNDAGWARQSPLAGFGAGGVFTFPNLVPSGPAYQIFAPTSPDPINLGPGRAGSLRTDESYTNFFMAVDLVDWDETRTSMAMGLLARTSSNPGLGTTNAYSLVLEANGDFSMVVTTGEIPGPDIAFDNTFNLNPTTDYRLTFSGVGSNLTGRLYDLANLTTPISTISAVNSTYASGFGGLFVYDGNGVQNATAAFDNYTSAVPEPGSALMLILGAGAIAARRRRSVA